jgi:hypothetical protein
VLAFTECLGVTDVSYTRCCLCLRHFPLKFQRHRVVVIVVVVVVVVVVGRSWQATNVLQPVGLLYRPLLNVPAFRY